MEDKRNYGIVVLVVLLDQFSKYLARRFLPIFENPGLPFFGINLPGFFDLGVVGLGLIAFIFLYFRYWHSPRTAAAFSFILGGAISNLGDRIIRGNVTDFIDIGIGNTFNLADVAIIIGIVVLIVESRKLKVKND